MRFSQFCDQAENTGQEQQLLQFLQQDEMKEAEKAFRKLTRIPIIGKLFAALVAMSNYDSIADFRQSEHYRNIKDWNFSVDFEENRLSISPNEEQRRKIIKTVVLFGAVTALITIRRKSSGRKK